MGSNSDFGANPDKETCRPGYSTFSVRGAGMIQISDECNASTGGVTGFSFGVEWGQFGYAAGVLSKEEAIKLAKHILRSINLNELDIK